MRKITIRITEELFKTFKKKLVDDGLSQQEFLLRAIKKYVKGESSVAERTWQWKRVKCLKFASYTVYSDPADPNEILVVDQDGKRLELNTAAHEWEDCEDQRAIIEKLVAASKSEDWEE